MKKRIACFHAHHSNIQHIEKALKPYWVELIHFVDPGLDRIKTDADFTDEIAQRKIHQTLEWISKCHVDAILITCTFFTAVMPQEGIPGLTIPIVKIDEPLFQEICQIDQPQILVFTNPNTVHGTMDQLHRFAKYLDKSIHVEPILLPNTFELIMQGKQGEYIEQVAKGLTQIGVQHPDTNIFAAQLSMVPAAAQIQQQNGTRIGHPLDSLSRCLEHTLHLQHG
jgi:hypothetical protein